MRNQFLSKINRLVIALTGVMVLGIGSAYAGTAYTNGRAFLKQGSPTGGGKVYVASNATEPTSGQYKAVTSSTSPAFNVQVAGDATFNYWAVANPGYIFTGWYTAEGALQSSGAAHISKKVTAGQAGASDTHAYADYYASFIKQIQLSFVVPTNGSFTITHCGSEVTPAYSSFTTEGKVVLTALPADGYKLRGWYTTTNGGVTKNYFAFGNSCEPNFTSNTTIGAEFVPDDGKATFWIKGTNQIYDNLTSANTAAASSSSKLIVVVSDGVVGAGTYTISSGVTLLIPYEETYNLMTTPNIKHIPSPNAASKVTSIFRKLTLASGATINVSGNICIGGSIASCNGGSPSSFPTGSVGMLDMSRGGTINLASGSNLYAWGYVKGQDMDQGNNTAASGVGEINAASGATVWEDYQVGEWRGGTASSTIYSNKGSWKFFPFQSYTIQNIEAPVNYAYGSNCKCYWTIFGNGSVYDVKFPLIASSGSLFQLKSGGTVRKWYDPTTDHVCFEMGGTAALDALTLTVMGETVSSSDYYLPIPANLKIILKSGNNLTVSKPMTMHAGSVVEIKSGATLTVNNRVHLFDADDWDTYCMYAYYYRTYYSPSLHFNRGEGTAKTTLEDATVIVDGTVDVKGAYLYSSAHGSNICGNGGGTFKYAALPSNTTMTQCTNLSDANSVNIRSANLHNDNGSYTKGTASKLFYNVNGRWFVTGKQNEKANHTYDFTYISSGDVYGTGGTNKTTPACWSKDKTGLVLQDKWANVKAQGCTNWWLGLDDGHLYNWSRNSAWHQYILTGSVTTGEGEEAVTTETYVGSDGKMLYKTDCEFVEAGTIDDNCLYPSNTALVNGSLITVAPNASPDHGYHKSDAATTYYLCFEGCVWHPATQNAVNRYTVDGKVYIWYGDKWLGVEYDSGVSLYYSLSATNVKIYYEYVNQEWVLATPVAEVVTSAGTEQVYSLATAVSKAASGGTNVTIRLLKNISGTINYTTGNNCSLDLNGFTLSSSTDKMINVNNASATFIIKDQSADGKGKVKLNYSANARRYAVYVTNGHAMLNSGTIEAINTMSYNSTSAKSTCVGAIYVAAGKRFTMNGGKIEAKAAYNPYAIYGDGAATTITIHGDTINCIATEKDSPYGIISYGVTNIYGGIINAIAETTSGVGIYVHASTSKQGHLTMTGGSIYVESKGSTTATGILVNRGLSYNSTDAEPRTIKQEYPAQADISGGTVTVKTKTTTRQAISSYGTTNITGGKFIAKEGTTTAFGVRLYAGTTTISGSAEFDVQATNTAYGVRISEEAPNTKGGPLYNGTLIMNGGKFTVTTTSDKPAYGVYVGAASTNVTTTHASDANYFAGNYANAGTATINGGEFIVTSAKTEAFPLFVEAALSGSFTGNPTPKCTVNGGQFKTLSTNGSTVAINNTAATLANFSMAGGYFNIAPNGTTNIAAGKTVKDLDATAEAALISAGYTKKIAGNEYTVTWKNYNGTTLLGQTRVESGKVPVWTGETPTYNSSTATLEFDGWSTEKKNAGTTYLNGAALPAIVDADVTYYAHYKTIYAEVIAGGSTTRYSGSANTAIQNAWNATKAYTNATLRILSNYGTEAAGGKCLQLVFNPTNANSTLTFDLNGHSWVHGNHGTASNNKDIFLHVNPAQANCKLIITDNSASGNGYLMNKQARTDGVLLCAKVTAGQLILQGGEIRVNNTADAENKKYSVGVQVNGSTQFTMTGGKVYATDGYSPRGINVSPSGNADIVGGTVHADATGGNAYGVLAYGTVAVGGDALVKATTAGSGAYPGYVDGGTLTVADSCSVVATAPSNARDLYVFNAGKITVNDKPTITATVTSGSEAYGCYVSGSGSEIEVNGGTYELTGAAASGSVMGVRAISSGVATINNGTFTLQGGNNWTFGVFAQTGTVNINGGDFTVSQASGGNKEGIRVYPDGTCNINGGTFTVTTIGSSGGNALHAYGGTTNISGNPVFNAYYGITVADGNVASEATTATVVVDGGTYNTQSFGVKSRTTSPTTGDVTVWDGKFKSAAGWNVLDNSSSTECLKIRGGWYSNNSSGKLATGSGNFVVSPSTVEALTSGPEYDAGYRYHVISKYNVTWSINGVNTVQEYSRNETPSYGSTPTIDDGNTWEFLGWSPELAPVTADVTYTAQFRKYEAEVYEGENPTPKRFEHFTDAWSAAKNLPVAKVKLLSNVSMSTQLVLTPDSAAGSKPLTLDLNNHTLAYTGTTDRFVIVNKAGCVLKVADSSVANGGVLKYEGSYNGGIYTVVSYSGDIVLESGKIFAKNTYAGKSSRAVTPCGTTTFTMTGGTAEAHAATDARAIAQDGTPSINVSGGKVIAKSYTISGDTVWGSTSYGICMGHGSLSVSGNPIITSDASASALGVYMYNSDASFEIDGGTFTSKAHNGSASYCIYTNTNSVGNIIRGGTFKAIGLNGGQIHAVHAIGSSKIDISGGTFTSHANAGQSHCLFVQSGGTLNVSGGSFTAESDAPSNGNIEAVRMWTGGVVNISGGTFTSTGASNNIALRNLGGTATISGGTFTSGNYTIGVAEAGSIGSVGDVRVNINGGTFISTTNRNIYASTNEGTTSVAVTVNGGYFHSAGTYVVEKAGTATIVLNGGKYNETSGSNHKTNITSYKGSTTTVSDISETVAGKTYVYELLTKFSISWRGGSSYTKDEQIYSGIVPTNNELVGKYFLRNDSAFYFTGWSPTPTAVAGDATYQALGEYHVAKVTVAAKDSIFDDFDEAWNYAMTQTNATITLLNNITRTESLLYIPENANARHTFDLNNFTIKENTKDRLLVVNKSDAKLTITDNSSEKGGCLYKKMNSSANMYTTVIYHGEMILAGGKIYVENTKDDKAWHPALAVHTSVSTDGIFTMTGGTVESQAKYLAYPIYNYATTNISGGTIIANATTQGSALGFYAVAGTATISGGTFNITASTNAIGAIATGWISADGSNNQQGTLNITGGTFNVSCTTSGAHAVQATGTGKKVGGTYYTSHGIMNVSGGTFNVTCPPIAAATQVFAAQVNAWRQFDNALPHTMVAEARGEMNISGGTFTVDARNNGAWVANSGNVDLLRNWGTLNVSGGNFTIHQYSTPSAISVFRGKATVTGNPVFNVYAHTGNAYAVCAGYWTHENYCDKNAANNLAEAEVNGGTYNIITEGQNTNVIYSLGQISAESRDAVADTITAHAGYAMNAKVTVNGGTFLGICPNESGHYPIMLNSRTDQVGTYGTAKSEIYVNGGKFKSRKGTSYETSTTTGAVNCHNVVGTLLLTGGYYETSGQLAAQKADTCEIIEITSAEVDPEYNNGYRYMIKTHYVARVTATGVDRKFTTFRGAFDYAKTIANSKITLLDNINYTGLNFVYNPATATTCTLDLNGYTFKGAISGHTGDGAYNNDRLLVINKAGATFTIKDSSVGKTGKWIHEKGGAGFAVIVYHGTCVMESGTVHCKNTSGGSAQALRSENYSDAFITMTGGKAHAETAGTAYGLNAYNKATISGGEILAESSAGAAYGVFNNEAIDTTIISGGKIKASGTNSYGVLARAVTTISGGKILSECTSADGTAFGVKTEQNATTINGVDSIYAHAARYAYGVHCQGSTAVVTINGANKIIAHNVNSANNGASIAAYVLSSGTININNGTFYAKCDRAGSSNVQTTRTGQNGVLNISGGTFHAEGFQAVNARGGTTTISGGTFTSTTGICAMDWADAATITANVNVTGGTFTTTGTTIYVSSNNANNGGRNGHSVVWINGGKFKSTGSTIVSMNATPSGADPSTLTIAGGYFNEKSGTTFKDQISTYVADTSEINTLDPLYEGIYKYEVAPHYVAKVQTGSTTKYHTTAKAAFDYAKTVANPTITLLDNCTLSPDGDATNYNRLNSNSWTGTLDLNNFILTPTISSEGRAFTVSGTGSKLTITDNSGAKGGKIYYQGPSTASLIYFVVEGSAEVELAAGTLYVEDTSADKVAVGFVVNSSTAKFTQSGGTFTVKGKYQAQGYYGSGTATFSGGSMYVEGETSQAIGLHPNAATAVLNVSGTFELDAKSTNNAYAVYAENGTATIEGTPDFYAESPTRARVLQGTSSGNLTVDGGTFEANGTTASQSDCYVLIPEGTSTITVNGGKFKNNQNNFTYKASGATLTINGGYFNETSGTNHKTKIDPYKGSGKVVLNLDTDDAEYAAGYRYLVTDDPVAKVTIGSAITYHTSVADAFTKAKTGDDATITILKDITGQTALTYDVAKTCTLDLNNHLVKGAVSTKLLNINKSGSTFVITDESVDKGGELYNEKSGEETYYGVYLTAGTLKLLAGKVHAKNTKDDYASATTAAKRCMARGVGVASGQTFQMSGGEVEGESIYAGYGVETAGTTTISGGTIHAKTSKFTVARGIFSTGSTTITGGTIKATAYSSTSQGIYVNGGTTYISSGDSVIIESKSTTSSTVSGIYVNSGTFNANTGCKLRASVEAKTSTTYGVYVVGGRTANIYAGKFIVKSTTGTAYGVYSSGTTKIYGGTYNVSTGSSTKAYGIYADRGTVTVNNSPEFTVHAGTKTAYGVYATGYIPAKGATPRSTKTFDSSVTINGGTFTVSTGTAEGAYGAVAYRVSKEVLTTTSDSVPGNYARKGSIVINDGVFDVTSAKTTSYGVWCNSAVTAKKYTGDGDNAGSVTATPTLTISGGKFKMTSTNDANATAYAMNKDATADNLVVQGGYYSTKKTGSSTNIESKYTHSGKATSLYRVFDIVPALESKYNYKVARFNTITYNKGANGTGTIAAGYKAKDDNFTLSSSTFTRTGYTQTGWSESDGGAKVYELGGTYSENADLTVYPFWSAQNYTLTLNNQSATTAGTTSITVTYNSNTNLTATPAITLPTKTGYTFGGYYVGQGGSEKQVIAANGNVNASVSGITDASKNWIAATGGTIYAKWTQTVTLHDNNGGNHNGSLEVTYNATKKSGTPPTREGYTVEGYYAEPACTNKVLTTAAVWVNYSGWVEGGKWVHDGESTLYTKWIEDTHTVTVAAGANGSASPASVTAGITTPSETITATPNTGYHFDNWTIPSGVTIASGSSTSPSITINATADDLTITANFAVNSYDVTLNTNGGTINAGNVTSYTYGVGATLPTDVTKAGYTFAGWFDNSELTGSAVTTISTTATGDKEYWAKWTPVALTFTGATDNQWSKSSNWEPACVPTEAHDIYIQKPCSVDIEHAVAKSIVIDQSSSHTGKLTVGANKGLEVVGTISRTTTGEDNLSTRTEDLILETSTAGNATLIFDNSNSNAATVDLYSKGYIDGSGTKNYQYIGVPVTEANAASNFYGSWMYSWGIKKNGAWGWVSVKNGASVYPWTGYCITQQEPTYYAIEGTLVPTTTKDITVPADENMVVGNSWTAPIDINALTTDDLEGLLANIYFFNTGVDKTGSGSEAEARYAGGTYVTVPIHAAPYKDGDDHINSMQGFFVKNTDKSATGTLHLDYDKHVRGTTRGSIIGDALHAPKHAQVEEPVVLKIKVSGENYDDKLLLLEREDFSTGFDNGWDGDKWDGNESALYLYTTDSEGTENSVSAIPELEGTVIGFRAGEDNSYTMYFDYLNSDEAIYLYDIEANIYTRIETGGIYWFMTNDNEKHDRFIITRKSPQIATGGGNVQSDDVQGTKARKLIIEDKMFIMVDGKLFDATGKMVK